MDELNNNVEVIYRRADRWDEQFLREVLLVALFDQEPSKYPQFDSEHLDLYRCLNDPSLGRYIDRWGRRAGDVGFIAESEIGWRAGAAWYRSYTPEEQSDITASGITVPHHELCIGVFRGYRTQGVGTQLMQLLLRQGSGDNIGELGLAVSNKNKVAKRFTGGWDLRA